MGDKLKTLCALDFIQEVRNSKNIREKFCFNGCVRELKREMNTYDWKRKVIFRD